MDDNELINKFFDGSLTGDEIKILKERLEDKEFQKRFSVFFKLISSLEISEDQLKSRKITMNVFRIAASIIIIIGLGTGIFFTLRKSNLIDDTLTKIDTTIIQKDSVDLKDSLESKYMTNYFAENFMPNPTIEGLIEKSSFRNINKIIQIISPIDSSIYKTNQDIPFEVSIDKDIDILKVIIYNNRNNKVKTINLKNSIQQKFELTLDPGIYYWKIEFNENSAWGGKFLIIN